MPSAFGHALVGGSLSLLMPRGSRALGIAAVLGLLAAAPDLDVIAFRLGIPYDHPLGHRGLSHSLCLAAGVAALSLPLCRRGAPQRAGRLCLLVFLAVASHGLLDALTDAGLGIGLLLPFDDTRWFAPWRPIATSPLSVTAFFTRSGARVLASEALWLGLPCLGALALDRWLLRRAAPMARQGARSERHSSRPIS